MYEYAYTMGMPSWRWQVYPANNILLSKIRDKFQSLSCDGSMQMIKDKFVRSSSYMIYLEIITAVICQNMRRICVDICKN